MQSEEDPWSSAPFPGVSDPIGSGFVANLARPGGNITGVMLYEEGIAGKAMEIPRASRDSPASAITRSRWTMVVPLPRLEVPHETQMKPFFAFDETIFRRPVLNSSSQLVTNGRRVAEREKQ